MTVTKMLKQFRSLGIVSIIFFALWQISRNLETNQYLNDYSMLPYEIVDDLELGRQIKRKWHHRQGSLALACTEEGDILMVIKIRYNKHEMPGLRSAYGKGSFGINTQRIPIENLEPVLDEYKNFHTIISDPISDSVIDSILTQLETIEEKNIRRQVGMSSGEGSELFFPNSKIMRTDKPRMFVDNCKNRQQT